MEYFEELLEHIESIISPYSLTESSKASLRQYIREYDKDLIYECIDIGVSSYLIHNEDGSLDRDSVDEFLSKLGGILHNKSISPLESEINHVCAALAKAFGNKNSFTTKRLMKSYITALQNQSWSEEQIISDIQSEVIPLIRKCHSSSIWENRIEGWIEDINSWSQEDEIIHTGALIPEQVYKSAPKYIMKIIDQINSGYDHKLYDSVAVLMRRLLEILLILSFKELCKDDSLKGKDDRYFHLDRIIKVAINDSDLALSSSTKKTLTSIKELGDYSAHKLWYNASKKDIDNVKISYRAVIEELLYKSGIND